jgi:hypothetical protein
LATGAANKLFLKKRLKMDALIYCGLGVPLHSIDERK